MNRAEAILGALRVAGAEVGVDGGRLRVRAATGVIPPDLRMGMAAAKDGILALLAAEETAKDASTDHGRVDAPDATLGIAESAGAAPAEGVDGGRIDLDQHVANALALSPAERTAWRREIVHALVWAEAGRGQDAHLAGDLQALRRVVPPERCLRCDAPCPANGRHWCRSCSAGYPKVTEVIR